MKIILFMLSLIIITTSCNNSKKPKFYLVSSETNEGKKAIEDYSIRYFCDDTWSLLDADIKRTEGVFAYKHQVTRDSFEILQMSDKAVSKLALKPSFSFWEEHGIWIAILMLPFAILLLFLWQEGYILGFIVTVVTAPFVWLGYWIKKYW